jgi:ubiquitin carboxyl-terminal hydrolase 1
VLSQIDLEAERCSRGETMNIGLKIAGPDENIFRDILAHLAVASYS